KVEEFRNGAAIVSEEDGTLLAEQIFAMNREQIDAQLALDDVNERLARLDAAVRARGSGAAFDGVESTVIDELRLEEMRLRQSESQLLSTLGPRHPKVVTIRSELERRREQMVEEAQRLRSGLRNQQQLAQQRLASIQNSIARLQ